jgi:hypothetical protein
MPVTLCTCDPAKNIASGTAFIQLCLKNFGLASALVFSATSSCRPCIKALSAACCVLGINARVPDTAPVPRPTQLNPTPGHFAPRQSTWYRCPGIDPPHDLTAWHTSCGWHLQSALGRARFGAHFSR